MDFPDLVPSARQFTPGNWPVKTYQAQNGAEVRFLYGNRRTGMSLQLTYNNLSDAQAEQFLEHYRERRGTFETFVFTAMAAAKSGWSGGKDELGVEAWGNRWRYAEEPRIESIKPGISSVSVSLVGVF
jgi:hypothetical protein